MAHRRRFRNAQRLGDVAIGKLPDHAQQQAGPGNIAKASQRGEHLIVEIGLILDEPTVGGDGMVAVVAGRGVRNFATVDDERIGERNATPRGFFRMVEGGQPNDLRNPGGEIGAGGEVGQFAHGDYCRFLHNVVGLGAVARDGSGHQPTALVALRQKRGE
jgi:hypothetical protein